jgi:hypothetical protein
MSFAFSEEADKYFDNALDESWEILAASCNSPWPKLSAQNTMASRNITIIRKCIRLSLD